MTQKVRVCAFVLKNVSRSILIPVFYPIATIIITYTISLLYNLFAERRDKYFLREIRDSNLSELSDRGDYSVDYKNGVVKVYGDQGDGIDEDVVLCSYYYNNIKK